MSKAVNARQEARNGNMTSKSKRYVDLPTKAPRDSNDRENVQKDINVSFTRALRQVQHYTRTHEITSSRDSVYTGATGKYLFYAT
jgi:hypothetical protein